jgi:hypothetical protein
MPKYERPFVECDFHKGPQRSYVICNHVMFEKAPVCHVDPATDTEIGAIVCDKEHEESAEGLSLICEGCAIAHGFIPDPNPDASIKMVHRSVNDPNTKPS